MTYLFICLSLQSCFVIKVKIWLGNRKEGGLLSSWLLSTSGDTQVGEDAGLLNTAGRKWKTGCKKQGKVSLYRYLIDLRKVQVVDELDWKQRKIKKKVMRSQQECTTQDGRFVLEPLGFFLFYSQVMYSKYSKTIFFLVHVLINFSFRDWKPFQWFLRYFVASIKMLTSSEFFQNPTDLCSLLRIFRMVSFFGGEQQVPFLVHGAHEDLA